ncbi:hypothetical protein B484DRAFT_395140 [Ochromonadaceae sp. CCMP2298]|nr:hypothetical protein B484DRAFT_395140 [Ochromonadaceae sp. CCMP2298]
MSTARVQEYLGNIPLVTKALLFVNVAIHIILFLTSFPVNLLAINPLFIIYRGEYYRLVSSAFVHGGVLHILMNMSSLVALGTMLENSYGSMRMLFLTLWSLVLCGCTFVALVWLYAMASQQPGELNTSAVGYSGVLFTYALIESFHATETSRSVFGCFNVPTKIYPFILLVLLQVVMPNISWWGHLSGLLVGLMLISRPGALLLMPSNDCLLLIEQSGCCRPLMQFSGFVLLKDKELVHSYLELSGGGAVDFWGLATGAGQLLWMTFTYALYALRMVWNVLAVALYAVGCPVPLIEGAFTHACDAVFRRYEAVRSCCERQGQEDEAGAGMVGGLSACWRGLYHGLSGYSQVSQQPLAEPEAHQLSAQAVAAASRHPVPVATRAREPAGKQGDVEFV